MIELTKVVGLASIQDGGRPGWMHAGVPRGGAMSPELLAAANAAAENAPSAAAIEAFGDLELFAVSAVRVATDARGARELAPGERLLVRRPPELLRERSRTGRNSEPRGRSSGSILRSRYAGLASVR